MDKIDYLLAIEPLIKNYNNVVKNVKVIPNFRTDGGGRRDNDSRLIALSNLINILSEKVHNNILMLHDHKGILTVYANEFCYDTVLLCKYCWGFFNESEIEFEFLNDSTNDK